MASRDENRQRHEYHGVRSRSPDSLGPAGRSEPHMYGNEGNRRTEHEGFHERIEHIVRMPEQACTIEKRLPPQFEGHLGGQHPRGNADEVGEGYEQGHRDDHRQHPWGRENLDRVSTHRLQGVDLLGNLHRTELGRDPGADPADHHDGREDRPHLENDALDHNRPHDVKRDLTLHLVAALLARHDADECGRDQDDRNALDADDIELPQDVTAKDSEPQARDTDVPRQQTELPRVLSNRGGPAARRRRKSGPRTRTGPKPMMIGGSHAPTRQR